MSNIVEKIKKGAKYRVLFCSYFLELKFYKLYNCYIVVFIRMFSKKRQNTKDEWEETNE